MVFDLLANAGDDDVAVAVVCIGIFDDVADLVFVVVCLAVVVFVGLLLGVMMTWRRW